MYNLQFRKYFPKEERLFFHDGDRYHIETSPLLRANPLYDNGLRHERVKI